MAVPYIRYLESAFETHAGTVVSASCCLKKLKIHDTRSLGCVGCPSVVCYATPIAIAMIRKMSCSSNDLRAMSMYDFGLMYIQVDWLDKRWVTISMMSIRNRFVPLPHEV